MISTVATMGFGSFGRIAYVVTFGYGAFGTSNVGPGRLEFTVPKSLLSCTMEE